MNKMQRPPSLEELRQVIGPAEAWFNNKELLAVNALFDIVHDQDLMLQSLLGEFQEQKGAAH
jgi:hypothetical protein